MLPSRPFLPGRAFARTTLVASLLLATVDGALGQAAAQAMTCNLSGFRAAGSLTAAVAADALAMSWNGAGQEQLQMRLALVNGTPTVRSLGVRRGATGAYANLVTDGRFDFTIVEGFRRMSNQQLTPLRQLGVEITPAVIEKYKWDAFWDAPLDMSTPAAGRGAGAAAADAPAGRAGAAAGAGAAGGRAAGAGAAGRAAGAGAAGAPAGGRAAGAAGAGAAGAGAAAAGGDPAAAGRAAGGGGGGNPPPAAGVANQPGIPRDPNEVRRGSIAFQGSGCGVTSEGRRMSAHFSGLRMGSFTGELVVTAYEGTNLIRAEVVASTTLPSVAYKYDVGLTGLRLAQGSSVSWRDLTNQTQAYALRGPANAGQVVLRTANRLVVGQAGGASVAAFPPPHTFFWAREIEINRGYNWYRKDNATSFTIGIRQAESEATENYLANWALYSAPPGSRQHMAVYFYPTLGDASQAFTGALAFTRGDVYKALPGYKVMGTHYHTNFGSRLLASGSLDTRLEDFEVLRAAGINIAGPVDRPGEATQLDELHALFEGAVRHSDENFMVLPELENSNLLGGHWDLFFSHPVYYVDSRAAGTPLVTQNGKYGKQYNIGSAEDMMAMVEAEQMMISMPHPRTKGSTGYPDAVKDSPAFLNDRYRGVGWRWGMGSDLSDERLSEKRVLPLLDDMNNWIAKTPLKLKYMQAITETYAKAPGDDIYANGPVTYLHINALPTGNDYSSIVNTMMNGDFFVSSGEVLIPTHHFEGTGANMTLVADVEWTFPLAFVEVVYGDGTKTDRKIVRTPETTAFGKQTFRIPFNATGQAWVRFAAWDTAGNGAAGMPVRVGGE